MAVHIIILPFAFVLATVVPSVFAHAVDLVLVPLASILRAILPGIGTLAVLLPLLVLAFVLRVVVPELYAVAVLEIVLPVALVRSAVAVSVLAFAVGLVSLPSSLVFVAIDMPESTLAVGLVVLPVSFVLSAIGPDLDAVAVAYAALPLALVLGSVVEDKLFSLFAILEVVRLTVGAVHVPVLFLLVVIVEIVAPEVRGPSQPHTGGIGSTELSLVSLLVADELVMHASSHATTADVVTLRLLTDSWWLLVEIVVGIVSRSILQALKLLGNVLSYFTAASPSLDLDYKFDVLLGHLAHFLHPILVEGGLGESLKVGNLRGDCRC
uniref:Uncharacterized protein n=1 Tax=Strombidium inclinatum TaxID=197538 RepID=A0A7S3IYC2_9SPIT|mmetsp:Transcript_6689/g.10745  ORF Transcript_6689/g.10745 Transcript_6689/m.10745 type:complete len:324 (+) Transcript_6689:302-1273(+)